MTRETSKKVAVIGATGYGGLQILKLLKEHPNYDIAFLGGERSSGKRWNDICPFLTLDQNPTVQKPEVNLIAANSDYAILCLPNGLASRLVPELVSRDVRVVDLSADYRYRSLEQWKDVYVRISDQNPRDDSDLCSEAIYGLPEWNFSKIQSAQLVAAPGCFPTASLLPLLPFLKQGLIETDGIVIDAKTGTSGGGRVPQEHLLFSEASETISPYAVIGHRHTSEIEQLASEVAGHDLQIQFTPNLVPMVRGILSTVYARLRDPGLTAEDCTTVLDAFYRDHETVDVLSVGTYPSTKWVRNTNKSLLSVQVDTRTGRIVLMSVIDNLLKGQAGQAIQCLNIMNNLPQTLGLPLLGFYP